MNLTKRQTIAIVSNTSWSIYNFRLGLIQHLKKQGFEVLVIAPKDAFSSKLISEGFHYHHVDIQNYGINPFNDIRTALQLIRIYRKNTAAPHHEFALHLWLDLCRVRGFF